MEELIAKARAPVKREYVILNCGPRQMATSVVMTDKIIPSDVVAEVEENKNGDVPQVPTIRTVETVAVDKKSKRQMKRERKEVCHVPYITNFQMQISMLCVGKHHRVLLINFVSIANLFYFHISCVTFY